METRLHNYFLFSWPSSLSGMASALDLGGVSTSYNTSQTDREADLNAILDDWKAIGEDFKKAIEDVKKEQA